MKNKEELYSKIEQINQKGLVDLQQLIGDYDFSRYVLKILRIEEPVEAQLSLIVVRVPQLIAGFPQNLIQTPVGRTALEDLLTRKVAAEIEKTASYDTAGISRRRLYFTQPGQKILPRSSLVVTEEYVEARIYFRPPLQDGHIMGDDLKELFFGMLPRIVNASLIYCNLTESEAERCVNLMSDADYIRRLCRRAVGSALSPSARTSAAPPVPTGPIRTVTDCWKWTTPSPSRSTSRKPAPCAVSACPPGSPSFSATPIPGVAS